MTHVTPLDPPMDAPGSFYVIGKGPRVLRALQTVKSLSAPHLNQPDPVYLGAVRSGRVL